MPAIPSIQEAQAAYQQGTSQKAQKWEQRTAAAANVWESNAKSAQAEQAYAQGVQQAINNQLRLKGLQTVSAAEFSSAVRGKSGLYQQETARKAAKWAARFSPYLDIIRSVAPSLPPKVPGDVMGNIQRRVGGIAVPLHQAKMGGAGAVASPQFTGTAPTGSLLAQQSPYGY